MRGLILALCVVGAAAAASAPAAPTTSYGSCEKKGAHDDGARPARKPAAIKVKRKIATHAKKDVRLGASADESKDSAH